MAQFYRHQVSELHAALRDETDATRLQAGEILRSLIKEIVLTPEDGVLQIDVRGDLAGILTIAVGGKAAGVSKQKGRPFGAASVHDVVSQFELDAGAGSNLHLRPEQVKMVAGTGVDHDLRSAPVKMVAGACTHLNLLFRTAA